MVGYQGNVLVPYLPVLWSRTISACSSTGSVATIVRPLWSRMALGEVYQIRRSGYGERCCWTRQEASVLGREQTRTVSLGIGALWASHVP